MKKLHKANDALKAFTHVNKKATEYVSLPLMGARLTPGRQYTTFTKQRSDLLLRRDELDASAVSIEELIDVLDLRKDEAIERTFKMVSKYFGEVFEKLVPAGRGRLVMQRRQVRSPLLSFVYTDELEGGRGGFRGTSGGRSRTRVGRRGDDPRPEEEEINEHRIVHGCRYSRLVQLEAQRRTKNSTTLRRSKSARRPRYECVIPSLPFRRDEECETDVAKRKFLRFRNVILLRSISLTRLTPTSMRIEELE